MIQLPFISWSREVEPRVTRISGRNQDNWTPLSYCFLGQRRLIGTSGALLRSILNESRAVQHSVGGSEESGHQEDWGAHELALEVE